MRLLATWLEEPEVGLAIGVIGLVATVVGVLLTVRGVRVARDAEQRMGEVWRATGESVLRGVETALFELLHSPAPGEPDRDVQPEARDQRAEPSPNLPLAEPAFQQTTSPPKRDLRSHAADGGMTFVGLADVTNDGVQELLVQRHRPDGGVELKVFAWEELDLVVIGDFANSSGASFTVEGTDYTVIVTLDRDTVDLGPEMVEVRYRWADGTFVRSICPQVAPSRAYYERPAWTD